jgi:hypothetical protein
VRGTHVVGLLAGSLLGAASGVAQPPCASWMAAALAAPPLDLAPPRGYTEVCSQDAALCRRLTAGYPPDVAAAQQLTRQWLACLTAGGRGTPRGQRPPAP